MLLDDGVRLQVVQFVHATVVCLQVRTNDREREVSDECGQLIQALVKLVVADNRNLEASSLERVDRQFTLSIGCPLRIMELAAREALTTGEISAEPQKFCLGCFSEE